ncbi:MAG: LamG-like jellyroll fold domain-containing protein [Vicingaceae bacterium]
MTLATTDGAEFDLYSIDLINEFVCFNCCTLSITLTGYKDGSLVNGATYTSSNTGLSTTFSVSGDSDFDEIDSLRITASSGDLTATLIDNIVWAPAFTGCNLSASITAQNNIACKGDNNGSLTVTQSSGSTPIDYSWSNGSTTSNSSSSTNTTSFLAAGFYRVTVTDNNGCTATASSTITEPATALSASASVAANISCNGGADGGATASASGGTMPYTYSWSNGATSASISSVTAGTYTLTLTDNNGCTTTSNTTITEPTALVASALVSSNVSAIGGTDGAATASATGGTGAYTYSWNTGGTSATESNLAAGTYYVTVSDANGCFDSASVSVNGPAGALNFDDTDDYITVPHHSSLNLSAVTIEAWVYWTNSGTTVDFISGKGIEQLEVHTGGSAGSNSLRFIPTAGVYLDAPAGSFTSNQWNHIACVYDPTVSEAVIYINGSTVSLTNRGSNPITTAITNTTDALNLGIRNGGSYPFSGALDEVRIWNRALCQSEIQFNRNCENPGKKDGLVAYYDFNNGSAGGNNTGLTTLSDQSSQSNDGTLVNFTLNGSSSNWASATNFSNCSTYNPPAISASIVTTTALSCNGDSNGAISASATGGNSYSYLWSTGATSSSISGLAAGTYSLTVTSECEGKDTVQYTLTEPSAITATAVVSGAISCNGSSNGELTASATGGTAPYTYSWNNGATSASTTGVSAGTYTVSVTDNNGCGPTTASVTITEPIVLSASTFIDNSVSINGGSDGGATASATGGTMPYTYAWSNGATTASITGISAGSYTVSISDNNGCGPATAAVTITEPTALVAAISIDANVSCNGLSDGGATASATGGVTPYTYAWNNGTTNASITGVSAGTYTITITDNNGATATANGTITEPTALIASTSVDNNVSCVSNTDGAASASATGGTTPYTYTWNTGATSASLNGLNPSNYTVTVSDANGCTDVASVTVNKDTACLFAPQNLLSRFIQDTAVRLNWDTVQGATLYKVLWRKTSESTWNRYVRNIPLGRLDLDTLEAGTKYFWAVRAYKPGIGWSPFSSLENFTTLDNPCLIPDGLEANAITDTRVRFMWNIKANTILYRLRYREVGSMAWQKESIQGDRDRLFITTLSPATTYEWQIKSVCLYGNSTGTVWSPTQSFTTEALSSAPQLQRSKIVPEISEESNIEIFPNPNKGVFFIKTGAIEGNVEVKIIDLSGKEVFAKTYPSSGKIELDIPFKSGVYLVQIINSKRQDIKRLIIHR